MSATTQRHVRIEDETWEGAKRRAALEHRSVAVVVQIALRAYVEGSYDAQEEPRRIQT